MIDGVSELIPTNISVLSQENDEEWRSILASLHENGSVMGRILVKHMYEELISKML